MEHGRDAWHLPDARALPIGPELVIIFKVPGGPFHVGRKDTRRFANSMLMGVRSSAQNTVDRFSSAARRKLLVLKREHVLGVRLVALDEVVQELLTAKRRGVADPLVLDPVRGLASVKEAVVAPIC